MKKKVISNLSFFTIAILIGIACQKEDSFTNSGLNPVASNIQAVDDGDPRKDWRSLIVEEIVTELGIIVKNYRCWYPPTSCMPDIVIIPEGTTKLLPANNFKAAVGAGTTNAFFGTDEAAFLFEELGEDTLEMLQDPNITIIQNPGINSDSNELYFVTELAQLNSLYSTFGCDTITSDSTIKAECMKELIEVLYDNGDIIFTFPFYYGEE